MGEHASGGGGGAAKMKVSVDVIDDLLYIGPALTAAVTSRAVPLTLRRVVPNWIPYIASFDEAAGVVVVRAELNDHVPIVLKVRALAEIGALPVVLAEQPTTAHVQRLLQAGAYRVLTREQSFNDLLSVLQGIGRGVSPEPWGQQRPVEAEMLGTARLSDRELQVVSLYTGWSAPSATVISKSIGVPLGSVRTHLQRARSALREVGPTSSRESLRAALIASGWIDDRSIPLG